jgi:alkylation response protein AidB-like acyl-CoA dehydrogenase
MTLIASVEPAEQSSLPLLDELLQRARMLRPLIAERARQAEIDGRVSEEMTRMLVDAGLYRLTQPKRYGGYELGPSALLKLGFEIGQSCGSTGWCAMIANVNAWLASYWPIEAQTQIWGARADNLVTGTFVPTGKCEATDGGYLVSGRWPFASNCDNSNWMFVSALLPDQGGQPQGVGWFMVPRDALSIDADSWQVTGMQGTGSKTLYVDAPIFVPENRVVKFSDVVHGTTPGHAILGNSMAGFWFATWGAVTLVAPLLGMAQGALDWFATTMQSKVRSSLKPGAPVTAAQSPFTQMRVGEASAKIDAAMALLLSDLGPLEAKVRAGEILNIEERIRIRRDIGFAARQATETINLLFEGAGATSAALDAPIQRYWRDINAAARHASLDVQSIYAMVGQHRFGIQPIGPF